LDIGHSLLAVGYSSKGRTANSSLLPCDKLVRPIAEIETLVTHSGLTIYVPKEGYQCWDAPLPCTPVGNSNLRLRKEGDMGHGFILDSENQ